MIRQPWNITVSDRKMEDLSTVAEIDDETEGEATVEFVGVEIGL